MKKSTGGIFVNVIILRQIKYSESSLLIFCLSHEKGLIKILAYNVNKIGKKTFPIVGLFRHLHVELASKKTTDDDLFIMKKADLIADHDIIAHSYDHYQSVCFLSQFILKNFHGGEINSFFKSLLSVFTAYKQQAKIKMWESIFLFVYLIESGYFHPEEEQDKNRSLIEKIMKVEDNFLELNQIHDRVWDDLHKWLIERCNFHDLVIPVKL